MSHFWPLTGAAAGQKWDMQEAAGAAGAAGAVAAVIGGPRRWWR
ncbi:hypothetical protein P0L94_11275 [Microbacter sp. GSS18]|nr:hypothetical protein P0L94_11275 [Microbacter sp. GSS18]